MSLTRRSTGWPTTGWRSVLKRQTHWAFVDSENSIVGTNTAILVGNGQDSGVSPRIAVGVSYGRIRVCAINAGGCLAIAKIPQTLQRELIDGTLIINDRHTGPWLTPNQDLARIDLNRRRHVEDNDIFADLVSDAQRIANIHRHVKDTAIVELMEIGVAGLRQSGAVAKDISGAWSSLA